jgi:hypothetical protein
VTKHDSKDAAPDSRVSGYVLPSTSIDNALDTRFIDTKHFAYKSVGRDGSRCEKPYFSDDVVIEFADVLIGSHRGFTVDVTMTHVFFSGNPDEVFNSVIAAIPVQVGTVVFERPSADKCLKHGDMDFLCESFLVGVIEKDLPVSVSHGSDNKSRNFSGCSMISKASDVADVRSLVEAFKARNVFPYFIHGEALT